MQWSAHNSRLLNWVFDVVNLVSTKFLLRNLSFSRSCAALNEYGTRLSGRK